MVLHKIDSNSTWVEAMPNCMQNTMIADHAFTFNCMRLAGLSPTHQILDNEASVKYKEAMTQSGMTYQLVPPNNYRCNIGRKAIHTAHQAYQKPQHRHPPPQQPQRTVIFQHYVRCPVHCRHAQPLGHLNGGLSPHT